MNKDKEVEFDSVLSRVGEFGVYQRRLCFLLCLVGIPASFHNLGYVFWAARPPHWCQAPGSANFSNLTRPEILNLTIPWEDHNGQMVRSQCLVRDMTGGNQTSMRNASTDMAAKLNGGEMKACDSWEYDTSVYTSTVVTEFNLVCERKWWTSTTQSVYMAGRLVGAILFGYLTDRFGRRSSLLASTVMAVVFSTCTAFAPNLYLFIILRFLVAVNSTGEFQTAFVIVMEIVGPSWRSFTGTLIMVFWALGYIMLAGIAYGIRDRLTLQLITSAPLAILFIYFWIVPESPRWLLAKGRDDEAMTIINKIAKTNAVQLPVDMKIIVKTEPKSKSTLLDLLRTTNIRRMSLVLFFIWFTNNIVYYGLSLNTSNLGGNDYFNFFVAGAVELPAYGMQYGLLKRCSRRWAFAGVMAGAGTMLLITWPIPEDLVWLRVTLAMVGKFAITISYGMLYVITAELFPTVVRTVGVGSCSFVARIGGILAPYAAELIRTLMEQDELHKGLPVLIFGMLSLLAAMFIVLLPDTKKTILPQTIPEAEASLKLRIPRLCHQKPVKDIVKVRDVQVNGISHAVAKEMKPLVTQVLDDKEPDEGIKDNDVVHVNGVLPNTSI